MMDAPPPTAHPTHPQRALSLRTCAACAASKVRCDRMLPVCGRCARSGLTCIEAPQTRRGQKRVLGQATTALLLNPSGGAADLDAATMLLSDQHTSSSAGGRGGGGGAAGGRRRKEPRPRAPETAIQETVTRAGAPAVEHMRGWVLMALERRSSLLFARAMAMAANARVPLTELFWAVPRKRAHPTYSERLPRGNPFAQVVRASRFNRNVDVCVVQTGSRVRNVHHLFPNPVAQVIQFMGADSDEGSDGDADAGGGGGGGGGDDDGAASAAAGTQPPSAEPFDGLCGHCGGPGHRKRECPTLGAIMAERRAQGLSPPRGQKGGRKRGLRRKRRRKLWRQGWQSWRKRSLLA